MLIVTLLAHAAAMFYFNMKRLTFWSGSNKIYFQDFHFAISKQSEKSGASLTRQTTGKRLDKYFVSPIENLIS
jgi:hypothetical protein